MGGDLVSMLLGFGTVGDMTEQPGIRTETVESWIVYSLSARFEAALCLRTTFHNSGERLVLD